jgi:hypothetical protein
MINKFEIGHLVFVTKGGLEKDRVYEVLENPIYDARVNIIYYKIKVFGNSQDTGIIYNAAFLERLVDYNEIKTGDIVRWINDEEPDVYTVVGIYFSTETTRVNANIQSIRTKYIFAVPTHELYLDGTAPNALIFWLENK